MKLLNQITALFLCIAICSCSLFVPAKQPVTVHSNVPKVSIMANGEMKGVTPVTFYAKKNQSLHIVATKPGYNPSVYTLDKELSGTGIADIIGGIFLLVPFIGFFSPAVWKLEQDSVMVPMHR